jgi:hypothetical protein
VPPINWIDLRTVPWRPRRRSNSIRAGEAGFSTVPVHLRIGIVADGTKLSVVVYNCVLVYIVVSVMCSACYFLINPQRGCEALCGDGTAAMLLGYGVHPLIPTGTRVNVKQRQQNSVPWFGQSEPDHPTERNNKRKHSSAVYLSMRVRVTGSEGVTATQRLPSTMKQAEQCFYTSLLRALHQRIDTVKTFSILPTSSSSLPTRSAWSA